MTDFEKYAASAEARKTTHSEHVDKLTGYFLAETNRMRVRNNQQPTEETPEPPPEPPQTPSKRVRWWQRLRRH